MSITPMAPADFSPNMLGYSGQGAFRFWCQQALPLVYDDSLSYYELLNKVVHYLNNTIQDVSNTETNVANLKSAYDELEGYVNTYFDSLDVQEEINTKLNTMAIDGTLTNMVSPFIPNLVTNWLNEHVTPTSPVVDASLSISGAAADAKATGGAVSELNGDLTEIRGHTKNIFEGEMEQGDIDYQTGQDTDNAKEYFIRSKSYIPVDTSIRAEDNQCYIVVSFTSKMNKMFIYLYGENHNFISSVLKNSGNETTSALLRENMFIVVPTNCKYIRIVISGSSGVNKYTPSDIDKIQIEYGYKSTYYVAPWTAKDDYARAEITKEIARTKSVKYLLTNVFDLSDENVEVGTIYVSGNPLSGQGNAWFTTGYIPCIGGDNFTQKDSIMWESWNTFYDANKNVVSWENDALKNVHTIPNDDRIKYVRFAVHNDYRNTVAIYKTDKKISKYFEYDVPFVYGYDVINEDYSIKDMIEGTSDMWKYSCGNIICFGDSLTDGLYADTSKGLIKENYPYYLGRMLNAEVENVGKNGSYPSECFTVTFPKQDMSKYDTAIIWLGTNGGLFTNEIDTNGTEANYYCKLVEAIKAQKADIQIFVGKVFATGELHTGVQYASVTETNTTIETIAQKYSLPIIDFSDLGTGTHLELHAGIQNNHFGKAGNIFIADRISRFIKDYYSEDITRVEFGLLSKPSHPA